MSSLTEAALLSKKAFFWVIIAICVIVAIFVFLGVGKNIKNALFPAGPAPATVAFGNLPALDVSNGYKAPAGVVYSLETISGDFPQFPGSLKVFAIGTEESSFGAVERTKEKAGQIGFRAAPLEISSGIFKFTDPENDQKTLVVNSLSGNFVMDSNYFSDLNIIGSRPPNEEAAKSIATQFFAKYGSDLSDFTPDKIAVRKLRIDGKNLTEAPALSSANLIEVNFYRQDLDGVSVYGAKKNAAEVSALVSQSGVVWAKANLVPILKNKFATYPLRSASEAFESLKGGSGFFDQPVTASSQNIIDVSLGYVIGEKTKDFLIPVYVFKSVSGTLAFVSAVEGKWVK